MMLDAQLKKLVDAGCIVRIGTDEFSVALAEVLNGGVFWCQMFPDNQSHAHWTQFDRHEIFYDRDVALYDSDGEMAAYFAPYQEFPEHAAGFEIDWRQWKAFLAERPSEFEAFVSDERSWYGGWSDVG